MDVHYNPYRDDTIHTIQPAPREALHAREGFNDVMKHYDAVNGFQAPKQLQQLPQSIRQLAKWFIILYVLASIVAFLVLVFDVVNAIK